MSKKENWPDLLPSLSLNAHKLPKKSDEIAESDEIHEVSVHFLFL